MKKANPNRIRRSGDQQPNMNMPGSRNAWWMDDCQKHGKTSFRTPFGCEACQRERLGETR